jgi:hypothetical protein
MSYFLLHVLHLLGAICFIGTLFFELVILTRIERSLGTAARAELRQAAGPASRAVLHWLVLVVYGAGLGLAWHHRQALAAPFASSFGTLLTLKILLALGVFASYGLLAVLLRRGRMTPVRYRALHWLIFAQMIGIVLLAKGMFYLHW